MSCISECSQICCFLHHRTTTNNIGSGMNPTNLSNSWLWKFLFSKCPMVSLCARPTHRPTRRLQSSTEARLPACIHATISSKGRGWSVSRISSDRWIQKRWFQSSNSFWAFSGFKMGAWIASPPGPKRAPAPNGWGCVESPLRLMDANTLILIHATHPNHFQS